ncbi:MAG: FadR family transcriptional regulator [Rhizobiaceae bacterium]|nr:FadR family transcriptional regulator [Rhizobiaceae bacterium]
MDGIAKAISDLIEEARLPEGGRLPTERELSERLGASRWQTRQALEKLEKEGRIWRHVGKGTFVGPRPAVDVSALRPLIDSSNPMEIVEARHTIEPALAAMAALRADPGQIAEIQSIGRRCSAARNIEIYEVWDEKLHVAIARAAGNKILLAMFETVNEMRKQVVWSTMRKSTLKPERRAHFSEQHRRIIEAIAARDADAANNAMREHMATNIEVYENVVRAKKFGLSVFRT